VGCDRLAVLDLEGGLQPLANEEGSLWLVLDGEIYNSDELRDELKGNHTFRTRLDAEVVLHLFEEVGPACFERLDGCYALALWGPETGLFLARDPLGLRPLYWGYDGSGHLHFASEIKALVDEVGEIRALPPGHYWQAGGPMVAFAQIPSPTAELTDPEPAMALVEERLHRAVRKRLAADVPIGFLLSGGLDSSLVAAIAREHMSGEVHTFAVGLEGSPDLHYARVVAEALGTTHHERVLTPEEAIAALPAVIDGLESCDPALVRSAIPTYFVAQMASRHVKVVFSGEGADELFAGYQYLAEFDGDDEALSRELYEITLATHNCNNQRVDRMTAVHGLAARVPFLDWDLLQLAFRIAPGLKRRGGEGKWLLRKVAERYLPDEVVWRSKAKFAMGTGIGPLLEAHAARLFPSGSGHPEEQLYWSLFRDRYGREDILAGMGRSRSLNPDQRWVSAL